MLPKIWTTGSNVYHVKYPESGIHHVVTLDEQGNWICTCGRERPCLEMEHVTVALIMASVAATEAEADAMMHEAEELLLKEMQRVG